MNFDDFAKQAFRYTKGSSGTVICAECATTLKKCKCGAAKRIFKALNIMRVESMPKDEIALLTVGREGNPHVVRVKNVGTPKG